MFLVQELDSEILSYFSPQNPVCLTHALSLFSQAGEDAAVL